MAAYRRLLSIATTCTCAFCRNYFAAAPHLSRTFLELLDRLRIDPGKAAEVYELDHDGDITYLYGGFYHLVCRIVRASDHHLPIPLADSVEICYTANAALVPHCFPGPALQLEFVINVPWVLSECPSD